MQKIILAYLRQKNQQLYCKFLNNTSSQFRALPFHDLLSHIIVPHLQEVIKCQPEFYTQIWCSLLFMNGVLIKNNFWNWTKIWNTFNNLKTTKLNVNLMSVYLWIYQIFTYNGFWNLSLSQVVGLPHFIPPTLDMNTTTEDPSRLLEHDVAIYDSF